MLLGIDFPGGSVVKKLPPRAGDAGSIPGSGKIPWRRKWQPAPVFLPEESHGQRNLAGYSPWGCKESDMTERLHFTTMLETGVRSLGGEDPLEKEMATHSGVLAWEIPWTEEPGRLYIPWGHKRVRYDLATNQQQQEDL